MTKEENRHEIAFWPLTRVKEICEKPNRVRLSQTRALNSFESPAEAYGSAKKILADLGERDFVETLHQNPDICDVYAVTFDERGWYVKLTIYEQRNGDVVMLISLHPLERVIRTARGHQVKP